MIVTRGTNAYISVKVEQMIDLGSHTLFIAGVTDMDVLSDVALTTYTYYQKNIKLKPEAVGKTPQGQTVWCCKSCGYEYVGEELSDNFICPICKFLIKMDMNSYLKRCGYNIVGVSGDYTVWKVK